jgi:hypothetical protein
MISHYRSFRENKQDAVDGLVFKGEIDYAPCQEE